MSSKDVLEKAKSLGIDVTSHLSNVTDEQATEIRNAYSKNNKNNVKKENKVENKRILIKESNPFIVFFTVWLLLRKNALQRLKLTGKRCKLFF